MIILKKFGEYIEESYQHKLSSDVLHHARRALLDWHAALICGANSATAAMLISSYQDDIGHGSCSVVGSNQKFSARSSAFINGSISHIAEFDDIFRDGAYHPGCPTISGSFALAELNDLTVEKLLEAIVVGYEISTRIAKVIQPSHYRFFHTTGTVGVFGSAAACSSVLGLSASRSCDALATAGSFASGLQQAFRSNSMTKPMHAGHAAEVGVNAALAAKAGMTGTADLLEGSVGFGAAMSINPRWDQVFHGLGSEFNISQMTFKNHGCCGHTFPAIDGVAAILDKEKIELNSIQKISIGTYRAACDVCSYRHPKTPFEAKFSLSYTVAARIILGRVREKSFLSDAISRSDIHELENKIDTYVDEGSTARFPDNREAQIRIELNDGTILTHHQLTRHGDPDDPLTDQELEDKFIELVEPRLGKTTADHLVEAIMNSKNIMVKDLSKIWAVNQSI